MYTPYDHYDYYFHRFVLYIAFVMTRKEVHHHIVHNNLKLEIKNGECDDVKSIQRKCLCLSLIMIYILKATYDICRIIDIQTALLLQ